MAFDDVLARATDAITVRRVFGEPIERDGVTVVPVALVAGGAGGGGGQSPSGDQGSGGGFGLAGRPLGVVVIRGGDVSFRPIVHPEQLMKAVSWLLVAAAVFLRRARR